MSPARAFSTVLLPLLLVGAVLLGSCSGGGVYTKGGWVVEGDDVIKVRPPTAAGAQAAYRHVLRVLEESPFTAEVRRPPHYVRTAARPLSDSLRVRFNVTVTDSAMIEVAGQLLRRPARHGAAPAATRIAWDQSRSRGDSPWSLMSALASSLGTIDAYWKDPEIDTVPCGGRRCPPEQVCRAQVCRPE
jgi:hypothetical protein